MKMNKIITMLLAGMIAVSAGMTVCASESAGPTPENNTADIKATYVGNATIPETVYYVDVEWGSLEYTYRNGTEKTWNPEKLVFEENGTAGWTCKEGANEIKVTNHSNAEVAVILSYDNSAMSNVTGTFSEDRFSLSTAENTSYEDGDSKTCTLTLGGSLDDIVTTKTKVGAINVTVKEKIGGFSLAAENPAAQYEIGPIERAETEGVYTVTFIRTNIVSGGNFQMKPSVEIGGTRYYLKRIMNGPEGNLVDDEAQASKYTSHYNEKTVITFNTNDMTFTYKKVNNS